MKILLVDVDSKIPNLALMKIARYYSLADVYLEQLNLSAYPHKKIATINTDGYDKVYISIIFEENANKLNIIGDCQNIYFGGTGYDITTKLPEEIDWLEPLYEIYPEKYVNDTSLGFITRGCIRNCYFCVVPEKEGKIYKYNDIDNIVRHKKVKFLDNNILAYPEHKSILQELVDKKIKCNFIQGLDIRLIDEENAKLLSELNVFGEYVFAFDNLKDKDIIEQKLSIVRKYIKQEWKIKFYLYVHPNMDLIRDVIYRVTWCKENKVLPYFMRDKSCYESKNKNIYTDFSAYCNQPSIFKKMDWYTFLERRHTNNERIIESKQIPNF